MERKALPKPPSFQAGVDPKFFAKKHKKAKHTKKMQANNTKAMSARAAAMEALVKPKEVKPKIPKGSGHLAYIAHPSLGSMLVRITKDLGLCQPKSEAKAQTKPQAVAVAAAQTQAQAPKGAQAPTKALSADVTTEGMGLEPYPEDKRGSFHGHSLEQASSNYGPRATCGGCAWNMAGIGSRWQSAKHGGIGHSGMVER
ncbi:hypothetical protein QTO34_009012 [Cnephaeus nilssonii]|uniref:60S ribosomal protein L29 n=1 Tax=Cnephaeus nilssonii TaxID=3371016 RepID=A0AA40LGK7_CNENI|nr:hypothetical protein QTO34_009012 [Eptesicus nilssonii]